MTQPAKDIERPLGLATKPPRQPRRVLPSARALALGTLTLCVFATSAAISLRDRPFRDPDRSAVSTPEMTAAPVAQPAPPPQVATAAPPPKPAAASGGPSIIHVNPDDAGKGDGVIVIHDPSTSGQDLRVAHLPERDMIEDGESGPLPIRAPDGRRPVDVYARPWSGARGARVAIVIGGLGVSQTGTQSAIAKLPPEVTLAFASGGNSIGRWMTEARHKGHE